MKRILLLALVAVLCVGTGMGQSAKSLMKSFTLDGVSSVNISLDVNPVITEWNEKYISVETSVGLPGGNQSLLEKLIQVGRYNIVAANDENGVMQVTCPKIKTKVVIGGKDLDEKIKFQIFVPKGLNYQIVPVEGKASDLTANHL